MSISLFWRLQFVVQWNCIVLHWEVFIIFCPPHLYNWGLCTCSSFHQNSKDVLVSFMKLERLWCKTAMTANNVRGGSWPTSPALMDPTLRQASQGTLTDKQEGGWLSVSYHKCGGKSPGIILSNPAKINTARREGECADTVTWSLWTKHLPCVRLCALLYLYIFVRTNLKP